MSCSSGEDEDEFAEGDSDYEGFSDDSDEDVETGSNSESAEGLRVNDMSNSDQTGPSEWIEFNKKVIAMRPLFKSAKVQFANKLTRQIKMLRNRKGDDGQVEKCQRKADRLVEEISYVNRLKKDIVAKFALLHSKEEIIQIMNDPSSSMEYRVKAKVAAMPKISKAAGDYHQTHPDWRETLIKLIQLSGLKMKRKRRKMRGTHKKSRKKKTEEQADRKKPNPVMVQADDDGTGRFDARNFPEPPPDFENVVSNDNSSEQGSSDSENGWKPPEVRVGSSSEGEPSSEDENKEDLNLLKPITNGKQDKIAETIPRAPKEPIRKKGKNEKRFQRTVQKTEKPSMNEMKRKNDTDHAKGKIPNSKNVGKLVKNLHVKKANETLGPSVSEQSESDGEETEGQSEHQKGNVDPFFMTSDNKAYKTLWKVEPADSFKNKDKEKEREPVFVFKNARTYEEVISGKPAKRPNNTAPNRKNKKQTGNPEQGPDPAKMHPSWVAKKKLNLASAPFQGKKIVFDDD